MPSSQFNYMLPPTYLVANNATAPVYVMAPEYPWNALAWARDEAPVYSQNWNGIYNYRSLAIEYPLEVRSATRWFERTAMLQSGALPSEL